MLSVVQSATLFGISGLCVRVEVDLAPGLPGFATVGLPENTVREARVRVQAAISNAGFGFPTGKITVNLAPAHLRKDGTALDLPIAIGILACQGMIQKDSFQKDCLLGELSLSGEIKPVRGILACVQAAYLHGSKRVFVPFENGPEAALVRGVEVYAVRHFADLVSFLIHGQSEHIVQAVQSVEPDTRADPLDLSDVKGQFQAKRALEIAAAGGHNLLFVGGPGSGKTMMAKRLGGILPTLTYEEAIEVTQVHSAVGLTLGKGLICARPFRAPHHSTTKAGLVGGGSGIPKPGELSLATHGVLFLDELPEFPRSVLEVLRQPLESGEVVLCRANATLTYPAKVMLVAAMNPCPCGNLGSPRKRCRCASFDIERYRSRLSGPLLDRIDMHVDVPPVEVDVLHSEHSAESSCIVRERVIKARKLQQERYGFTFTNASVPRQVLSKWGKLDQDGQRVLRLAMERLGLSARAHDRILRVARTIADLETSDFVSSCHLSEAIQYRGEESRLLTA